MVLIIRRNPDVAKGPDAIPDNGLLNSIGSTVALLLVAVVPEVGYCALLLLLVPGNVIRIRNRFASTRVA